MILLILKAFLIIAILGALVTLGMGLTSMVKDSQEASLKGNKLMCMRVTFQAIAVFLFTLVLILNSRG